MLYLYTITSYTTFPEVFFSPVTLKYVLRKLDNTFLLQNFTMFLHCPLPSGITNKKLDDNLILIF